jgi:hypothetical protein
VSQPVRDPNSRGFWLGIGALTFACVPYPFAGTAEPVVVGVPLWFLISFAASVGLVATTIWAIRRRWRIEAPAGDLAD